VDVSTELRGLARLGMDRLDGDLARWPAGERLFDPEGPNQEPQLSAVRVLVAHDDLPLLQRWLSDERLSRPVEAAALAEAALAQRMPASLWADWVSDRLGDDRPLETMAAFDGAVAATRLDLGSAMVEVMLASTRDPDRFRALAMSLAAVRDPGFVAALLEMAGEVEGVLIDPYLEALEVARHPRREQVMAAVRLRRQAERRTRR
jgi:hypothetical protein